MATNGSSGGMRVLVSEYLCGGGWTEARMAPSLAAEGRTMLQAAIEDLLQIDELQVVTTWNARFPLAPLQHHPRLEVRVVRHAEDELETLSRLAANLDHALVIAPECDGLLRDRCQWLRECGVSLLNCSDEAIRACGDKLAFFQCCQAWQIPTLGTSSVECDPPSLPCVVKLRDGAGSQQMQRISSQQQWNLWRRNTRTEQFIVQPFQPGQAWSIAAFCQHGELKFLLPPCRQMLSDDSVFQYLGGKVTAVSPFADSLIHQTRTLMKRVIENIDGLHGYIGIDFIAQPETDQVTIVELNPRLTTSYVGYRQLTKGNLAHWILNPSRQPRPQFTGSVSFLPDGTIVEKCL